MFFNDESFSRNCIILSSFSDVGKYLSRYDELRTTMDIL